MRGQFPLTLLCVLCFIGCAPKRQALDVAPIYVAKQDQAASSHVSVISVSRWEEYAEALQPKFSLKPEEALALAVPVTMRLEEKFVDALSARLKLAPPTSSETVTSTSSDTSKQTNTTNSSTAADGTTTTVSAGTGVSENATGRSSSASEGPGSTAALAFAPPTVPDVSSIGASGILQGGVTTDPMARFAAATALYQEVQLLNRYVRDAAIRRDSVPYVVRLQISLLPVLRGQAYDASALISFFTGGETPVVIPKVVLAPQAGTPRIVPAALTESRGRKFESGDSQTSGNAQAQAKEETVNVPCMTTPPTVVPVLVTDNLESAAHSRSMASIRELGLALGILSGNFGAGANVDSVQRSLASLVGGDVNGLLTVGRVSDNTLRVRLGAALQAESRYAMVPRTHNVTVLLFVPRAKQGEKSDCVSRVRLVARTEVTDAIRGRVLESRTTAEIALRLREIAAKYRVTASDETLEALRISAQQNRFNEFVSRLANPTSQAGANLTTPDEIPRYAEAIWLELTSLLVGSQFSPSTFELPSALNTQLPESGTRVLLLDDGKNQATATLVSGTNLLASQLSASLKVVDSGGNREFSLPAGKVDVNESRQAVQFTFRTLTPLVANAASAKYELSVHRSPSPWEAEVAAPPRVYNAVQFISVAPAPPAESPFSVSSGARVIASDGGTGTLQVTFKRKPEAQGKVILSVTGGDLTGVPSANPADSIVRAGAEVLVVKDGTAELKLSNLTPESEVEVAVRDEKGVGPASVRVRVREIPKAPPAR